MSTTDAIDKVTVDVTVNGERYQREVEPRTLLVQLIREELRLTGTHIGCDTTYCGACTVVLNGKPVKSCTVLAAQADKGDVLTVETTHTTGGVIRNLRGHPLSPDTRLMERYWREPQEMDLRLELVIEDPANYTEAITLGRQWVWAPEEEVHGWECISLGPKDAEPDLDELARMLEEL